MTLPDHSSRRIYRTGSVTVRSRTGTPVEVTPAPAAAPSAAGSWPWRRGARLLAAAAQMITVAALEGADPIPATWAALLLAIAPAPLAALAAFTPAPVAPADPP